MVNTKRDTQHYDVDGQHSGEGYKREIFDANLLYESYLLAKKGSDWKPQVQKFEMNYLFNITQMQSELKDRTYQFKPTTDFIISERGKTRQITGEQIEDRIVKHAECDEHLNPAITPYLIYDNGASQKNKGIDFTRRRLVKHLRSFYQEYGNNDGYILIMDDKKYYDNIRHDNFIHQFDGKINDTAMWFLEKSLKRAEVDVSYMSDDEYAKCMETIFNSLEYWKIPKEKLTGEKWMRKHMNVGDPIAQTAGVSYQIRIDNYITIVKGMKRYARYMDDSYVISNDKQELIDLLNEIVVMARDIGVTINPKKTHIYKLSEYWRFLQIQYSLTDTGRIIHKINPKRLTAMRRKLKKIAPKMTEKEFKYYFKSWMEAHCKYMSKQQRKNMDELYAELKEVTKCTQSL